ncbi:putative membrane protein [Francisella tularensis subsp. novicida]|nr:putative membrane protein [Francisella tularensis subsp. novicida]
MRMEPITKPSLAVIIGKANMPPPIMVPTIIIIDPKIFILLLLFISLLYSVSFKNNCHSNLELIFLYNLVLTVLGFYL